MKSTEKVQALTGRVDELVAAAGNEQLTGALTIAKGFGLDVGAAILALLPADPDQLDAQLVALAIQALKARSDDASTFVIGCAGGTIYSLQELRRDGTAQEHIDSAPVEPPAAPTTPRIGDTITVAPAPAAAADVGSGPGSEAAGSATEVSAPAPAPPTPPTP